VLCFINESSPLPFAHANLTTRGNIGLNSDYVPLSQTTTKLPDIKSSTPNTRSGRRVTGRNPRASVPKVPLNLPQIPGAGGYVPMPPPPGMTGYMYPPSGGGGGPAPAPPGSMFPPINPSAPGTSRIYAPATYDMMGSYQAAVPFAAMPGAAPGPGPIGAFAPVPPSGRRGTKTSMMGPGHGHVAQAGAASPQNQRILAELSKLDAEIQNYH
jgi:hypothetical protein